MGKKITRGNRVQRFKGWSPEHKQAVLDKLGVSLEDFRSYGGGKKERVLNRAFDGHKPSGGGSNPSQPAFDRNDPAAFSAPQSYNQVLHQGRAAADIQYGPQQQILQQQATNIPSWFDQYRSSLSAAQTQQQQMTQPMLDQTAARADNAGKPVLKDADPNSQASQDDVLAAAGRKALIEAGLAALQGTAAATQGYLAGRVGVANSAQTQAQTDNTTAQKGLAAERGNFLTDYVSKGRENERRYGLESAAFGLDQYKAEAGAADDAADNARQSAQDRRNRRDKRKQNARQDRLDLAKYDTNRNGKLDPGEAVKRDSAKSKEPKAPTAGQQKITSQIRRGVELVRQKDNGLPNYWHESYQRLVRNDGLDPIIARAIINAARTGRVGNKTAAALLEEYGISKVTIPGHAPKRPGPTALKRPDNAGSAYGDRPT